MTNDSTSGRSVADRDGRNAADAPKKSTEMRTADTANGENPDDDAAATSAADSQAAHPTGEGQARKNREDDPPA